MVDELLLSDPVAPPRRYSVDFATSECEWLGPRLRIFLDGVEQNHVVEHDCGAGTVLKIKCAPDGQFMLNEWRDDVLRELVRGAVTVEFKD